MAQENRIGSLLQLLEGESFPKADKLKWYLKMKFNVEITDAEASKIVEIQQG